MRAALPMAPAQRISRWQSMVLGWLDLEIVDQPFALLRGESVRVVVAVDRAEFGDEVLLAGHARARHPRVEEVRLKAHLDRHVRLERNRLFKPALADEAPRADDVGHHVDRKRGHRAAPHLRG
jgi:hypothetical protein